MTSKTSERKKYEEFYAPYDVYGDNEEEEEEESCPEGFTDDDDCGAPFRLGIEYCEFMCPFHRLDGLLDLTQCYYCGNEIKKGEILCKECAPEKWK